jgi:hypothetical protein
MTGWLDSSPDGDQPMTRRQLRERERMLAQQNADDAPDAAGSDVTDAPPVDAVDDSEPLMDSQTTDTAGYEEFRDRVNPDGSLTRRELRALYSAQQQQGAQQQEAPNPGPASGAMDVVTADSPIDDVMTAWSVPDTDGHSVHTTSIVLPTLPTHGEMQQALNSTGAILLTGSMDLPHGVGATGADPERFDSPEIDRLIDAADGEGHVVFDAEPVRASQAISNSSSTSVLVQPPAGRRPGLPVVLAGTGAVLIVGVGTLLYFALGIGF